MLQVSEKEIETRLRLDNPWWEAGGGIHQEYRNFPRRAYLTLFSRLMRTPDIQRAIVLMGPRRVGKTILVYHAIQQLLDGGEVSGRDILYISLETPLFTGLSLESLVRRFRELFGRPAGTQMFIFFDEIQYLKQWELHLKSLVDSYRDCRFIATGSAAAALKTKSAESGAGRFTDFALPPLTFAEYLRFINREDELIESVEGAESPRFVTRQIHELNSEFINYLNLGGYPEAVFNEQVRANPRRFIKSDIIDKVLLRDLPSLYGISDIQELNSLFNTLAYNTAQELSLEDLSKASHVTKVTLNRYLEYLEAAFLIRRVRRIDQNARHFKRMTTFKVFLTNPTMRAALFGPVNEHHEAIGHLAETAVFSQWLHNTAYINSIHYARWPRGEVDFVSLDPALLRPRFAVEIKWSDHAFDDPKAIKGLLDFTKKHHLQRMPLVTTQTKSGIRNFDGTPVEFAPVSVHSYTVAKNTLERRPYA